MHTGRQESPSFLLKGFSIDFVQLVQVDLTPTFIQDSVRLKSPSFRLKGIFIYYVDYVCRVDTRSFSRAVSSIKKRKKRKCSIPLDTIAAPSRHQWRPYCQRVLNKRSSSTAGLLIQSHGEHSPYSKQA